MKIFAAGSSSLTPVTLLRIGGVLACLVDAVFTVVHRFRSPNRFANLGDAVFGVDLPLAVLVASDIVVFVMVAASFCIWRRSSTWFRRLGGRPRCCWFKF